MITFILLVILLGQRRLNGKYYIEEGDEINHAKL